MRTNDRLLTLAGTLTAALLLVAARPCASQLAPVSLHPIGATQSQASDVNNSGQVVGAYVTGSSSTAVIWNSAGEMTPLVDATWTGGNTLARGINDSGLVFGSISSLLGASAGAFIWDDGNIVNVPKLAYNGVPIWECYPVAMNDDGWLIGGSYNTATGVHGWIYRHGVDSVAEELTNPAIPGSRIAAFAINNAGQVAGHANYGSYSALIWEKDAGGTVTITELVPNMIGSDARGINDAGQVAIQDQNGPVYLWTGGALTPVVLPTDYTGVQVVDIDESGRIFGIGSAGSPRLWMWQDGALKDCPVAGQQLAGYEFFRINNAGQMTGYVYIDDLPHGFLWNAVDGASGLQMLDGLEGGGSAGLGLNGLGEVAGYATLSVDNSTLRHACVWGAPPPAVNHPPVLTSPGNRSAAEGHALTFTLAATDPDLPAQTLTFSATGLPDGALLDSATGAFSWTPSIEQGPGSYVVTFTVTDNGTPAMNDSKTITITVNEVNEAMADLDLGGYSQSYPAGVNASGRVIGMHYTRVAPAPTHKRPFYWDKSGTSTWLPVLDPLPTLGGDVHAVSDINDAGQIIGYSGGVADNTGHVCTWRWDSANSAYVLTDLGVVGCPWDINASGRFVADVDEGSGLWTLGADGAYTMAVLPLPDTGRYEPYYYSGSYLNDAGLIAGWAGFAGYKGGVTVVWENGADPAGFVELPTLTRTIEGATVTDNLSDGYALSEAGILVGYSGDRNRMYPDEPVYWEKDAGAWSVHNLPHPDATNAVVSGLNNAGLLIGIGYDKSGKSYSALVWEKDGSGTWQVQTLPSLKPGDAYVTVHAVNEAGQIVGYSGSAYPNCRAVLWQKESAGTWQVQDLGTLGGDYALGRYISDSGMVAGNSLIPGNSAWHAFALQVEVPETNHAPTLILPATAFDVTVGTPVTFTAKATDPDKGDTLTFSLSGAPAGAAITPETGVVTWMPTTSGEFTFDVTVTDGELFDTKPVTVDVGPALSVGKATAAKKGKSVTVDVLLTNRSATVAANVTLTTATLTGVPSSSSLKVGTIQPGATVTVTLSFKNVPSGNVQLVLGGASSLGGFSSTQAVKVP